MPFISKARKKLNCFKVTIFLYQNKLCVRHLVLLQDIFLNEQVGNGRVKETYLNLLLINS